MEAGNIKDGTVEKIMPFGVFVAMEGNRSGLVHISEISSGYIKDISEVLSVGDHVKVKVLGTDEKGRINLSIKQAQTKEEEKGRSKKSLRPSDEPFSKNDTELSFEEKLMRFKQDSDENMRILKRSAESKRSGGYSRKGSR